MESDKEQNQMTEKELQDEKKERRSIRIGAIIATVVMFVPVCSALYKLTERVMDSWPQTGYIYFVYLYMWVFLFALFGAVVWLFGETVCFIIVDLLRHNVQDERHKLYDKRSDAIYDNLAKHLFFVIKGWILLWMLLVPLLIPIMES